MEHSLLDKCLEFTRDIVMIGQSFTLNLKLGSDLNFSFDYQEKMNPTLLEELNIPSKTKLNEMETKKKVSPSTKKRNTKRREYFIKSKSENFARNASSEVSHETTKARNYEKYEMFKCDKCTYKDRSKDSMNEHIKTKHKNINEESYRNSKEIPEIPRHIEYITECKNVICQEIRNLCKDPDLCFCEYDP